ncbi:MAG: GNAT family N-acetyltransferase [Candidatus Brocadiia bacterium]
MRYEFNEIADYLKVNGLLAFIKSFIWHFIYRRERMILMMRSLHDPIPNRPLPGGFEFRKGVPEDVEFLHRMLSAHKFWRSSATLHRLTGGEGIPLVAVGQGNIVAFACVIDHLPKRDPVLQKALDVESTDAWVTGVFVHPQYRGRGIGSAIAAEAMKRAKDAGYGRIWSVVLADTQSARAAMVKAGYEKTAKLVLWRVLCFKGVRRKMHDEKK